MSTNDSAAAAAEADRGLTLLRRKGVWAWAGELAPAAATAYCLAGRPSDAASLIAELESATAGIDAPLTSAALPACRAELANARGETAVAIAEFEQAKLSYDKLPRPYEAIRVAERGASCRLTLGEPDAADEFVDLADAIGAVHDAARCRHLSRAAGATRHSRRGQRGYGNQLAPRERTVAQLMARRPDQPRNRRREVPVPTHDRTARIQRPAQNRCPLAARPDQPDRTARGYGSYRGEAQTLTSER